jgi:hypothetical protein
MRGRVHKALWLTAVVSGVLASVLSVAGSDASHDGDPAETTRITFRRASLPVRVEHRYRMLGKVRPLLFWISRDGIGGAQITWREAPDAAGYELLIGSNPERAPRRINRWGYIGEEVSGTEATVFGVMKQSSEESLEEAETRIAEEARQPGYTFKAIQGTTSGRSSQARVLTVQADRDLTYRDIDPLIALFAKAGHDVRTRHLTIPSGAQPGFLTALADLIQRSVDSHRQDRNRPPATPVTSYVYNGALHDLKVDHSRVLHVLEAGGRQYREVIQSRFESRSRTTDLVTNFQITYGTEGPLAGIPVHAVYQPRWWLEVQLFLDDEVDF